MLIYYICSENCTRQSFERRFANELQRIDIPLWSTSISVTFGDSGISSDIDDNYGDTTAAIVIASRDLFHEPSTIDIVKTTSRYETIKFIFVLNKISKVEFNSLIEEKLPELKSKVNNKQVYDRNDGINNITSEIGLYLSKMTRGETERISSGIDVLDYLLAGGFVKGSAFNIIGPSGSGKTTLGVQIQKAILESGLGCLYITYSEAPIRILRRFTELGCDITQYINNGKFRIFDSYSALNGLDSEATKRSVGLDWFPAIVRVDNPSDSKTYFELQIKVIEQIGPGGVNIIDNSNKRYEMAQMQKDISEETYKAHFSRFKAKAGDSLQNVGIHIVEADDSHDELIKHLTRLEDGNLILKHEIDETGKLIRKLCVEPRGQLGRGDTKWYEYVITQKGIRILPANFDLVNNLK